jgi:anti-sigma-K factor RskA
MISDPNVAVVSLKGTEKAPKSAANIYWDSTSANVYLVVKNMPKLPSEKQYQLWAIINGQDGQLQPTSLGLFDIGEDGKIILKMDTGAKRADAFAITIENRGNTGGPTLEELQAMGKPSL